MLSVYSPISGPQRFDYEGGMFFGRGTFHAPDIYGAGVASIIGALVVLPIKKVR